MVRHEKKIIIIHAKAANICGGVDEDGFVDGILYKCFLKSSKLILINEVVSIF